MLFEAWRDYPGRASVWRRFADRQVSGAWSACRSCAGWGRHFGERAVGLDLAGRGSVRLEGTRESDPPQRQWGTWIETSPFRSRNGPKGSQCAIGKGSRAPVGWQVEVLALQAAALARQVLDLFYAASSHRYRKMEREEIGHHRRRCRTGVPRCSAPGHGRGCRGAVRAERPAHV